MNLRGSETARIQKHKLRFWFFGVRLYKVWSAITAKEYYIITNAHFPSYKYKSFVIHSGLKRIRNNLFIWKVDK